MLVNHAGATGHRGEVGTKTHNPEPALPSPTPAQTSGEILAEGKLACTGLKQAAGRGVCASVQ